VKIILDGSASEVRQPRLTGGDELHIGVAQSGRTIVKFAEMSGLLSGMAITTAPYLPTVTFEFADGSMAVLELTINDGGKVELSLTDDIHDKRTTELSFVELPGHLSRV